MVKKQKVQTFLYHEVVRNPEDSGFQRKNALPYKHSPEEFNKNIDIIVKNCKRIITCDELEKAEDLKVTMLTFDDGGKSSMHIADILDKHKIKGHFFITTGVIGNKFFLRNEDIKELHNRGHKIGSHSHSHPTVFSKLSYDDMFFEWSHSKEILENLLGETIDTCSIPGGQASMNAYVSSNDCGYKYVFNSEPTLEIKNHGNLKIIGRVCPKQGSSYELIENLSTFKGMRNQKIVWESKRFVKKIIHPFLKRKNLDD